MRKFFKSLAVLLALTLIVGVIPAAAADSLTMAKEKVLYLGGSQGAKEDGTNCKITAKKKVANMIKGFLPDSMTVVLSSADKSIVKTTKAGRIVAKSIGTTTVTVTVLDAAETQIFKQDLKVKVKKNATDVAVTGIADGDNFKVGQTVEVTLPRAGVDTDERELTVDKTENVEIKADVEKARVYSVKFVKAGEVTFTAKAFQSTKYPVPTQKKDIKVTISNPAPTSVKAVASNAYELTFDTDMEAAGLFKDPKEIANDACYYMLNETKVTQSAVKAVKATGNTVKVTMYDNFAAGQTYYVVINGSEPLPFTIAGTGAKDVVDIAILTDTVVYQTAADIKIALYNKDGVDIFESVKAANALNVALTTTNLNSFVDGLTLNMYNIGDVTDLTATFTYYDANNNYEAVPTSTTKKITAVDKASMIYTGVVYSVDNTGNEASQWYGNPKTYIALGDAGFAFKAAVKYTLNGNPGAVLVGTGLAADKFNDHDLVAKVPEEAIALVQNPTAGSSLYPITPNTVGKTNVFIGYYEKDGDTTTKFTTVAVAPIEVKAKRYPAALTARPHKANLNTYRGLPGGDDVVKIEAEVKDQYGDAFDLPASDLVATQNKQSEDAAKLNDTTWVYNYGTGKYRIDVDARDIGAYANGNNANIVVTVKVNRNDSKAPEVSCSFTAKNAGDQNLKSDKVEFVNNGASSLETTITATTALKAVKLQAQTSNNGFYTGKITNVAFVNTAPSKKNVATTAAVDPSPYFEVVIKRDGVVVSNNPVSRAAVDAYLKDDLRTNGYVQLDNFAGYQGGTINNFFNNKATIPDPNDSTATIANPKYEGNTRNLITKCPTGQYVFTIYKIQPADTEAKIVISSQSIVVNVTDKQEYPTFRQIYEKAPTVNDIVSCFKFSFGGYNDYNGNFIGTRWDGISRVTQPSNATNNWFVNSAEVTVGFELQNQANDWEKQDVIFNLESTINKLIKQGTR